GGRASQLPGATNVDIIAESGIRASATKLPFASGSVDEIIASNPYLDGTFNIMDWLPEAANVLKPGGQLIINATVKNPYAKLPSAQTLESLGLRVLQEQGQLLPQFRNQTFHITNGDPIQIEKMGSVILEKMP
ncbi:MAG: class I SAM-dependent methyltransferase, partial [Azoarcus sp.]|nr:class I SAM-dependent methyltransferase [Azoarcus sp.]